MSNWRRARLSAEMLLLYVLAPIAVYYFVYERGIPLLRILPWALAILLLLLAFENNYVWAAALARFPRFSDILKILLLFAVCGSALTAYAAYVFPQYFLALPREAPDLWLRIMVFYPAISVTVQEMLFRVFYFHRYAPLFGEHRNVAIIFNAALFAFAHATLFAYRHTPFPWEAVAISFAGGLIFARRFQTTRSFWAVALEHSLYGDLIFTIGLGVFFFTGVSNR